ncbi:RING-H2 finger protein [Actinidia chinensis var. chinensis]|uniref:RING-type E3 ubiquitin transferase n=1 Tax=Actinidia chinensis var. chinensis TaxID=1590841 RepID=A0A2R6RDL8_ACTCC|nr:RING-H2 finger protein [Actinidia chinensis var. chinensis]
MSTSTSSSTTQLLQDSLQQVYSRRLLLNTPLYQPPAAAAAPANGNSHYPAEPYPRDNSFDANVVMVLSVLLCALICSLGLNSIIRCALRCSSLVASESSVTPSARLANTGIKKKALRTFPIVNYSTGMDSECVICLSEFTPSERIKVLPKCHHGFHPRCIDKWLNSHSSCPTCRYCLIETCQKIVGHSQVASSSTHTPHAPQGTVVRIAPLEPEGLIRNYRGIS